MDAEKKIYFKSKHCSTHNIMQYLQITVPSFQFLWAWMFFSILKCISKSKWLYKLHPVQIWSHSEVDAEKKIDIEWKPCYCYDVIFANDLPLCQFFWAWMSFSMLKFLSKLKWPHKVHPIQIWSHLEVDAEKKIDSECKPCYCYDAIFANNPPL